MGCASSNLNKKMAKHNPKKNNRTQNGLHEIDQISDRNIRRMSRARWSNHNFMKLED